MHFRKAYEFCFSRNEILTSVKKELLLLQEDDQRLWFATWHQPDVSFETHGNSFKQKCTREHPIKERNWIWRLGKVTQTIEEKNYEDIPLNILAKLIKESHNNERQENTKCNFTNDRRQTAENESDLKNDEQNDRQQ